MADIVYSRGLEQYETSREDFERVLSVVITRQAVEKYLSALFQNGHTKYGISKMMLLSTLTNRNDGVIAILDLVLGESKADQDTKTFISTAVGKGEEIINRHIAAIVDEFIVDGILHVLLQSPKGSQDTIDTQGGQGDANLEIEGGNDTLTFYPVRFTILDIPMIAQLLKSTAWVHDVAMDSLYYQYNWYDVGRYLGELLSLRDRRDWTDFGHYLDELLSLHIAGLIEINFEYSSFKLSPSVKDLVVRQLDITKTARISKKLNEAYVREILHDMVRYSSIQFYSEVGYRQMLNRTIQQADTDGLLKSEEDRADAKRLLERTLYSMDRDNEIIYTHSTYQSPYYDFVEWLLPKSLTKDNYRNILAAAINFSHVEPKQPILVDYTKLVVGMSDAFSIVFTEQASHVLMVNINALIAYNRLEVGCRGIEISHLGLDNLARAGQFPDKRRLY